MKTYEKGAVGEMRVTGDLITQGFRVHKPLVDSLAYDLVCSKNGVFYTVQVKYVSLKNGVIDTTPRRVKASRERENNVEFDILAIYCPDTSECYYLFNDDFRSSIRLRVSEPKNNLTKGIHYAKDYTDLWKRISK